MAKERCLDLGHRVPSGADLKKLASFRGGKRFPSLQKVSCPSLALGKERRSRSGRGRGKGGHRMPCLKKMGDPSNNPVGSVLSLLAAQTPAARLPFRTSVEVHWQAGDPQHTTRLAPPMGLTAIWPWLSEVSPDIPCFAPHLGGARLDSPAPMPRFSRFRSWRPSHWFSPSHLEMVCRRSHISRHSPFSGSSSFLKASWTQAVARHARSPGSTGRRVVWQGHDENSDENRGCRGRPPTQ